MFRNRIGGIIPDEGQLKDRLLCQQISHWQLSCKQTQTKISRSTSGQCDLRSVNPRLQTVSAKQSVQY